MARTQLLTQPVYCSKSKAHTAFISKDKIDKTVLLRDFSFISSLMESSDKVRKKLSLVEDSVMKQKELMRFKILQTNARRRGVEI